MAEAGFDVAGIDPDADACRAARAIGLNVVQGSAEGFPRELANRRFDVVTMTHVLEHVLDPVPATANIAGLLHRGDRFFVETPNNACIGLREAGPTWR